MVSYLFEWDKKLFLWINGLSGSGLDYLFAWTTYMATAFGLILVFVLLKIWDEKHFAKHFVFVLMAVAGSVLIEKGIKLFVDRSRPYGFFYQDIDDGNVILNCIFNAHVSNSFPSGHTALVFATVAALNAVYDHKLWFLYPVALYLGLTRIYVGAHFPSDVLAGVLVGILGSLLAVQANKKLKVVAIGHGTP